MRPSRSSFGVCLGAMNFVFYQAIARLPLGVAVTIEFLGPLAVAVAGSRRPLDLLWVALAGTGVVLLTGGGTAHLSVPGVIFAGLAAVGWAAYIVLSAATGRRFPGSSGLVIAMLIAAVVVTPAALATRERLAAPPGRPRSPGRPSACCPRPSPTAWNSAALRRLPTRVFGIWMSLEPAVAALIGLALLGQHLSAGQWAAVGCVVAACIGAARSAPHAPHAPHPRRRLCMQRHLCRERGARRGTSAYIGRLRRRGRGRNADGDRTRGRNADGTNADGTRTGTEHGRGRNADGDGTRTEPDGTNRRPEARRAARTGGSGAIVRSERAGRSRDSYDG